MPTVNVFYQSEATKDFLRELPGKLKSHLAEKLSCGEITLTPNEVTVRFINVNGEGMIGEMEIEITAHAFAERVKKQDKICRELRAYILKEYPSLSDVRIWLILCELGHSW